MNGVGEAGWQGRASPQLGWNRCPRRPGEGEAPRKVRVRVPAAPERVSGWVRIQLTLKVLPSAPGQAASPGDHPCGGDPVDGLDVPGVLAATLTLVAEHISVEAAESWG